jgi:hypothetical protein
VAGHPRSDQPQARIGRCKPANATIISSRIEESARSALASFGATVALGGNVFACAPIDINVETYEGQPYVTNNLGGNGCGCPDIHDCKAQSANLAPPAPLNP